MKKILLYCLPLCLLFASCSDLLDEESYSETGKDNYLNNAKEAETVLQGVYKNLANEYTYSYHLSLLFTISTDIAQCEGSSTKSHQTLVPESDSKRVLANMPWRAWPNSWRKVSTSPRRSRAGRSSVGLLRFITSETWGRTLVPSFSIHWPWYSVIQAPPRLLARA